MAEPNKRYDWRYLADIDWNFHSDADGAFSWEQIRAAATIGVYRELAAVNRNLRQIIECPNVGKVLRAIPAIRRVVEQYAKPKRKRRR